MPSPPIKTSTRSLVPSVKLSVMPCASSLMTSARLANCTRSAGKTSASAASKSARWIVNCGAPYFFSAVSPISRREVSSPLFQVRLIRWLGRAAVLRTAVPTAWPRPSSARTALGVRLISAPTRKNCFDCSYTTTSWPARCKAMAAVRPPMPAPRTPILKVDINRSLSRFSAVGQELARGTFCIFLTTRVAIDTAINGPLGEHGWTRFKIACLPVGVELVFIGVILDQATSGILEIPEIRRRNRMTARAELGIPTLARHMHATTKYFVNIAHGKGHMIEAGTCFRRLQQEDIVMAADIGAAQERTAFGIMIRGHEAEVVAIKTFAGLDVLDEEHHVTDLDWRRAVIDRAALIDTVLFIPGIHLRTFNLNLMLKRHLKAHRQTVRIRAADTCTGVHISGQLLDATSELFQHVGSRHTPDHFAQGRTGFNCRWQAGVGAAAHDHATAVLRSKHQCVLSLLHQSHAPVEKKLFALRQIIRAVSDFIDT